MMGIFEKTYKKNISSGKIGSQILGALARHWVLTLLCLFSFSVGILTVVALLFPDPGFCRLWNAMTAAPVNKWISLIGLTIFLIALTRVCNTLSDINNLLRKENRITWCQIWILIGIGIWLLGVIFILGIQKEQKSLIGFGLIGSILAWVFQDKIKGAAAFIHFRMHKLLNIGDWIKVSKLDADGEVKKVTLTTVTLYNWDTTTSVIPIYVLQSEHFINLQNMVDGKTYGRKMQKDFTLDTGWIHPITEDEANRLKSEDYKIKDYLPEDEIRDGALNVHLFRLYLYHWLMSNPIISHYPRLIVRWMGHKDSGLVLQIYAFIINSDFATFEWQQSQIIEHIIISMEWFGLKLYQTPSAYDVSNSNIHIDNPEILTKEDKK